jgi:hypothetical protein
MNLSIDYDKTYTLDPRFWDTIIAAAEVAGHRVFCMTMRHPNESIEMPCPIYYTGRQAKVTYAKGHGIAVDVWIDDSPHWLLFDG